MPPMIPSPLSTLKSRLKEAGNVLFMILIAVALFAALAYGVTNSTRSTGGDASKETNILLASQITQYGTELQTAIMRMKVSNGCTDEQISFENPIVSGYTNANAPANYTCHVFRPEGGNVAWQNPPKGSTFSNYYNFSGALSLYDYPNGINAMDGTTSDLIIYTKISQETCYEINKRIGIPMPTQAAGRDGAEVMTVQKFSGTFTHQGWFPDDGAGAGDSAFRNQHAGCLYSSDGSGNAYTVTTTTPTFYFYYHVLVPR